MTAAAGRERLRLASALGLAVLALAVALVPLSVLARQNPLANGGETLIVAPFAAVGFVLAWRRPGNPIGWLSLAVAGCFLLSTDSGFYAALVYRQGLHLPLGPAALVLYELWGPAIGALLLVIMLFPDGRLPPGFWRWVWWASSALLALFLVALTVATIGVIAGHHIRLDTFDGLTAIDHPTGWFAATQTVFSLFGVLVLVGCVGRQLVNWRRSSGERRQQLKWLASGAVVGVTCLIAGLATGGDTAPAVLVASGIATVGVAADRRGWPGSCSRPRTRRPPPRPRGATHPIAVRTTPAAAAAPAISWIRPRRSLNNLCPAMAAMGASTTPTARTEAAGARARETNQRAEAMEPQSPAPSDWRQPAMTALGAPGAHTRSAPPSAIV